MQNRITDIHCPECGAPAHFDIRQQQYLCSYCGGKVGISEAQKEKQGFRKIQGGRLKDSVRKYKLFNASCSGCGASVVFEENEALSSCAFCGRNLVRKEYLYANNMPESVIPFGITAEEAGERLGAWCRENRGKPEAKKLLPLIPEIKGFYLPYELVRGPVHMRVSRMDGWKKFRCEGCMNDAFVNRSGQLDNLLLDGMEPFDIEGLTEFDFAYVAGHHVKIPDITEKELAERACREAEESYTPAVRKVLETKAVNIEADVGSSVRLPVLLPAYYICDGDFMAAVNGQTGKVSVRAEKESHYYFLPWWLKAIFATLIFSAAVYAALCLFGMETGGSLLITAVLALFFIIVTLCVYSDTTKNSFSVESGREIYTSGEKSFTRERGRLVLNDRILERRVEEPVFFSDINGTEQPIILKFTSPVRILRMLVLSVVVLFLPVLAGLLLNGFNPSMIRLGGSAVWFCIFVPVVPIYLLKFGVVELHDNPWVYTTGKNGRKKRYRKKFSLKDAGSIILTILKAMFVPPVSLAVWGGIISFCVMSYLTAGYGW